jgi:type I pantothenate kinase
VYSHLVYDVVPGESLAVGRPTCSSSRDQRAAAAAGAAAERGRLAVSDFIDFSIYVDADEADLERWYVERFLRLRDTAFRDPRSYFRRYAELSAADAARRPRGSGRRSTT